MWDNTCMERPEENYRTIEELQRAIDVLPEDFRPVLVDFFTRVTNNVIAENTRVEVLEDNSVITPPTIVSAGMRASYQEMFREVLSQRALNVYRFRQQVGRPRRISWH